MRQLVKTHPGTIVILVLLLLLRFWPALVSNQALVFGDNYSLQVPGRVYTANYLKQGIIPWWNPTIFAGIPWAQEISQTVFYPSTILFILLHPGQALNLSVIIHLLFSFWGMYLLLTYWSGKRLPAIIGSLLWTFSTQVTGSINNLVTIQSIAWFPWIGYVGLRLFESRKQMFIFSLLVLGQFLAGYPQHVVYAILLAVVLSAIHLYKKIRFRRFVSAWVLCGLLTFGITAVAWLPFLEVFSASTRMAQSVQQASVGSLHPLMLVKAFIPYFFDNPAAGFKWGPAWSGFPNSLFYITWIGIGSVLFGIKGRNHKTISLSIVVIFTLLFSLGNNLPGFSYIQEAIPFFKLGRYPSMMLVVTNLVLIILMTHGLDRLIRSTWIYKYVPYFSLGIIFFWTLFIFNAKILNELWPKADALLGQKLTQSQFHTLERDTIITQNIFLNIAVIFTLTTIAIVLIRKERWSLAVLVIGIDMIFNTQNMLFFAPLEVYSHPNTSKTSQLHLNLTDPQKRTLTRNTNMPYTDYGMYWEALTVRRPFSDSFVDDQELLTFRRLTQIKDSYTPDWNMPVSIPMIHGYTTLLPQDFSLLWQTESDTRINFIQNIELTNPLLSEWSVANYVVDTQFVIEEELPNTVPRPLTPLVDVYELPHLPRFRFEDNSPVEITSLQENPNSITLTVNNTAHERMVIADRFDSNWKATINGEWVEVQNYKGMRSILLQNGQNELVLQYVPTWFYIGLLLTLISVSVGVLWSRLISLPGVKYVSNNQYAD